MRERVIEKALREGVELLGGLCPKVRDPVRNGFPDRQAMYRGHIILVETKAKNGRLSVAQEKYHEDLRAAGVQVEVIWSLNQVYYFLRELSQLCSR